MRTFIKNQLSYFVFVLLLFNSSCQEEEKYDFPIVQTGEVVEIAESGVVFHGKIMNLGNQPVLDHGFVWDDVKSDPTIGLSYSNSLGELNTDIFQFNLETGLEKGKEYYARAFVSTEDFTIYGRTVSFKSLGSNFPLSTIGPWTKISRYPGNSIAYAGSFTIGNKAYVGGGEYDNQQKEEFWEYDPAGGIWTLKTSFLNNKSKVVASFATISKGYFLTRNSAVNANTLYQYDPIEDSWLYRLNLNLPYYEDIISAFSIGNKGYVISTIKIREYDEMTDSWKQIMATPPEMMMQGSGKVFGFLINSKCYLVSATAPLSRARIYEFEPENNSIKEVANLNLYFSEAFEIEGKIYLTSSTRGVIEYDPINGIVNTWTFSPYHQRTGAVSFSIGNKGYTGLGRGGRERYANEYLKDFWKFDSSKLE